MGLPLLIDHYQEHKEADKAISFLSFLKMHYAGEHPLDGHPQKDMRLPFKASADTGSASCLFALPLNYSYIYVRCMPLDGALCFYYNAGKDHYAVQSIWQPPKLA